VQKGGGMEYLEEIVRFKNGINKYIKKSSEELNIIDALILTTLKEKPDTLARDFSEIFETDPSYMTRNMIKLEKKDLVIRKRSGRKNYLFLTNKGEEVCREVMGTKNEILKELFTRIDSKDYRAGIRVLKTLTEILKEKI